MSLTAKQQRFVEEYCVDFNATQAAIRAGYSEKTAHVIGHENLSKPKIAEQVKSFLDERTEEAGITVAEIIQGLKTEAIGKHDSTSSARVAAWSHLAKYKGLFGAKGTEDDPIQHRVKIERVNTAPKPDGD